MSGEGGLETKLKEGWIGTGIKAIPRFALGGIKGFFRGLYEAFETVTHFPYIIYKSYMSEDNYFKSTFDTISKDDSYVSKIGRSLGMFPTWISGVGAATYGIYAAAKYYFGGPIVAGVLGAVDRKSVV